MYSKLKNIKNTDVDCFPNGQIELISDFIHNYSWSNGQSNQGSESKISNLNSGSYMVTVSPHPGCQQILNFDLCTCVGCHDDQNTYYPTCPTTPILITTDINTPIIKSSSYLPKI